MPLPSSSTVKWQKPIAERALIPNSPSEGLIATDAFPRALTDSSAKGMKTSSSDHNSSMRSRRRSSQASEESRPPTPAIADSSDMSFASPPPSGHSSKYGETTDENFAQSDLSDTHQHRFNAQNVNPERRLATLQMQGSSPGSSQVSPPPNVSRRRGSTSQSSTTWSNFAASQPSSSKRHNSQSDLLASSSDGPDGEDGVQSSGVETSKSFADSPENRIKQLRLSTPPPQPSRESRPSSAFSLMKGKQRQASRSSEEGRSSVAEIDDGRFIGTPQTPVKVRKRKASMRSTDSSAVSPEVARRRGDDGGGDDRKSRHKRHVSEKGAEYRKTLRRKRP